MFIDPHSQKHYILVKISRKSANAMSDPGRFYITDADNKILVKEETRFSTKDYIQNKELLSTNKGEAAGAPIGLEQVFATAQTKECSFCSIKRH